MFSLDIFRSRKWKSWFYRIKQTGEEVRKNVTEIGLNIIA